MLVKEIACSRASDRARSGGVSDTASPNGCMLIGEVELY